MAAKEIIRACERGDVAAVERLLPRIENPTDVKSDWWPKRTLLHFYCHRGLVDMTRRLVEQYHCDPESKDWYGNTPLHTACREGHVNIVGYLVNERGCSTACQNKYGYTPLLEACRDGRLAVVEILLTAKNCNTACNKHSRILLHYSCHHGWLDVTRRLVEQYHCDPGSGDKNGDTPLHEACREGHLDIVRYLASERGCSTACRTKGGNTPLHEACCDGHVDIVRYLVSELGCSTACQNKEGNTPLLEACRNGCLAVFEFLLIAQDCSTAWNKHSKLVLHYSCRHGWLDVTRRLVEQYHCDPESKDLYGDTPLHEACRKGHVDIVKYFVSERGCSTVWQNNKGITPLLEACRYGHLAVVEILLTAQDCSTACNKHSRLLLHYSCHHDWLDVTRRLVEQYHCDPQSRDWNGDTPLHEACGRGHVDIVRYLVGEQRCSTACINDNGNTPLLEACSYGHLAVVEVLLTAQDCSTACSKHSRFLLHYSCHLGWLDVTRRLVEQYHCDPQSRDWNGDTPLHEACGRGHVDIVRYLVGELGCSTACQNEYGNTPLHVASKYSRMDVVQFLLSSGRADPWCRNASSETPLQCSNSYEVSKLFADFAGLSNDRIPTGNIQPATKIFVFGNPAAGKSTLVKVIENKVTSHFGVFAGQFRSVSGVEVKTAGINTVTIQSSSLGIVTVYDLAGQFEYYSSHDALVGNLMFSSAAIFMVVIKLSESEAEVSQTLRYWISLIENCCCRVKATAHLIVVGSWADKVKEAGEDVDRFAGLDCRKLASSGLGKICSMIESSCTALKEAKVLKQKEIIYPHLLHAFINTKLHAQVACSVGELCTHITAEDSALLPTEPSLLSPLLSSLSDGGHLLYLPNKEDFEAGWVVMDKKVLLSKINGTIFAPEGFKQHCEISNSTGVVPKSKVANAFAEEYNVDMVLSVLTLFEFCHYINDSFALSLIADSDPSMRESGTAIAMGDEFSESYYFFPALVHVECPTDIWQSSGPGQYQCGWCLQCSKEWQFLTPRFLHVLLLRLAFSFALAPDTSQQDKASPVLRTRCAIWKNGIQWLDQDGVETIAEVSEHNRVVRLLMLCPEGEEMACVQLRSSLISKILKTKEELCPKISTTELLIDPSNLSSYPLPSSSELTLYRVADQVVKAVRECKPFIVDTTGRKKLKLEKALHFELYHSIQVRCIDRLFAKDIEDHEVDDSFLHNLAADIHTSLIQRVSTQAVLQMLSIRNAHHFYSYCEQFPTEKDNPAMRCFRLFLTWKNYDTNGATYQSLRTTLNKYSIFCGRNPISMVVDAGSSEAGGTSTGVESKSTQ